MQINGVELDFHLYDEDKADIRERYFAELKRMKNITEDLQDGTEAEKNKFLCGRVKEMFDIVFGVGTGESVCGAGNDLLIHLSAYEQLVTEQIHQNQEYEKVMDGIRNIGKMPMAGL